MSAPESVPMGSAPALFDNFHERRTRSQRRRAVRHAVISPLYRVYLRLRGGSR
jgi:hypothetical protein